MDDLKSYMRERVGTSSCSFDTHGDNAVGRSCANTMRHDTYKIESRQAVDS